MSRRLLARITADAAGLLEIGGFNAEAIREPAYVVSQNRTHRLDYQYAVHIR